VAATSTVKFYTVDNAGNASTVYTQQVKIDTVAPSNAIALSNITGNALLSGTTVYYRGVNAGSFTITNSVTDANSGASSSATAALGGTTTGWSHTPSSVGSPYVSNAFSWTAGASSSPTENVTGTDAAGNTAVTGLTYTNDSAGPTGGAVDATGLVGTGSRYRTALSVSVSFSTGADGGAGLAASGRKLYRATGTLTGGVCGSYGTATLLATDPSSPYADTVTDQACYQYQYYVPDLLANSATYLSGDVKVDTTAPSTPTWAASAMTNTYATGTTIYYRSTATSGAVTLTGSSTDVASGILSYSYPALGTGWSSAAGSLGVNTYSWASAGPAAPGTKNLTATDNAALTSANSPFTFTADNTAPTSAAVTYTNGPATDLTPTITLTMASDAGSGADDSAGVLQRKSATLSNGTCGSFGSFATVATGPGTSYDDAVNAGNCYMYQYLTFDNVGNAGTAATSANVLKVDYYSLVRADAGLVGYWRFGESQHGLDTFNSTTGTSLTARSADDGSTWTVSAGTTPVITSAKRLRRVGANGFDAYDNDAPGTADYSVEADVCIVTDNGAYYTGVSGRVNTGAGNSYYAQLDETSGYFQLWKKVSNTSTQLASSGSSYSLAAGTTYTLRLSMVGSTISVYVNGAQVISVTDSSVTAAGSGGIFNWGGGSATDTTGFHLDNYALMPRVADSKGSNTGDYWFSSHLDIPGALASDGNTAVTFASTSSYITIPDAAALDLGDTMTAEFWIKRANSATGIQSIVDKGSGSFKIYLNANKLVLAKSSGTGAGTVIATQAATITDAIWHHVAVVKNGSGTCYIYLDGTQVASGSGSGKTLTNTASPLTVGSATTSEDFVGSVDELALYSTALSATTIAGHSAIGHD
jgi:hypothetical protein